MVEVSNQNSDLKLKLCLDMGKKNKNMNKRVNSTADYATLLSQAKALCAQNAISEEGCKLRYSDGDSWVIIEDDQDLQFAITSAAATKKLAIKIRTAAQEEQEESKQGRAPRVKKEKAKKEPVMKLNRKTVKEFLRAELDEEAQFVFMRLLKTVDAPPADAEVSPGQAASGFTPGQTTEVNIYATGEAQNDPALVPIRFIKSHIKGLGGRKGQKTQGPKDPQNVQTELILGQI